MSHSAVLECALRNLTRTATSEVSEIMELRYKVPRACCNGSLQSAKMSTLSTSVASVALSVPAVAYNYSGGYFKPSALTIDGFDVTWPGLSLDYCAYACSDTRYFWIQSGLASHGKKAKIHKLTVRQTKIASAPGKCQILRQSINPTATLPAILRPISRVHRLSFFDFLSLRSLRRSLPVVLELPVQLRVSGTELAIGPTKAFTGLLRGLRDPGVHRREAREFQKATSTTSM